MIKACKNIYEYSNEDIPVTIYYAYKQSDTDEEDLGTATASSGWETMLNAIIHAGFSITGTWPVRTETTVALKTNWNALASSIVLVCRKRPAESPKCTRRSFINELKRELRPALQKLQSSNIAPVDLAQSAIGPGMGVFSKYGVVLESDGSAMTVRSALQIINQELDVYFNEQDGELDRDSRFCVELYSQYAFNDIKFGDADTLARAKNTSVAALASAGVVYAQKGVVHLYGREEIPEKVDHHEECIWLLTQQLTHAMETGGVKACAEIVAPMFGANAEHAKDLAYRLYTIAERKGWAQEAYAYNSLVIAWPEIQSQAAELQKIQPEQLSIFD
jgi:putative DNA methylase